MMAAGDLVRLSLVTIWVIFLPGIALLVWFRKSDRFELPWVYALGLGFALNPLIFEFFTLLNVPVTRITLSVVGGLFAACLLAWVATRGHRPRFESRASFAWSAIFLALFVAVFVLRREPIADQPVLPGVDAYQHVMVADLLIENEGLPDDYSPFATLDTFSYHFGTHANAAALALVADVPVDEAFLFLEPLLMGFAALATACLALAMTRSFFVAFAAAGLAGLVGVFPAWLMNWARLPQLAGAILVTLVLSVLIRGRKEQTHSSLPLVSILIAGTFLTHYRMTLVLLFGLTAYLLWRFSLVGWKELRTEAFPLVLAGGVALVLVAPWIVRLVSSLDLDQATRPRGLAPEYSFSADRLRQLTPIATTFWLPALAGAGLIVALLRRRTEVAFIVWWIVILLAFSNPYVVRVPAAGYVDFFTAVSSILFVPVSILAAYALCITVFPTQFSVSLRSEGAKISGYVPYLLLLGAALAIGAYQTRDVLYRSAIYVLPQDLPAIEWIDDNTPADARFLSSMYVSYNGLVVPNDAGAWITYFTEREQVAPPLIYGNEASPPGSYGMLRRLASERSEIGRFETYELLRSQGISHIYRGARSLFSLRALDDAPWYRPIFSNGDVKVYELIDPDELMLGG